MESWAWGAAGAAALAERGRHGHVVCPGREAAPVVGVREGLLRLPLLLAALGAAELDGAHFAVEGAEPFADLEPAGESPPPGFWEWALAASEGHDEYGELQSSPFAGSPPKPEAATRPGAGGRGAALQLMF